MTMENLSHCHFVYHISHADWRANDPTHFISFAFTYVVFEHLFLYLPALCQNVVSCKFLTNASLEFICISYFRFTKNEVVYGNSRHMKRALLFFNSSVQKSNRIHRCDLERNLLDIKKDSIIYICSWLTVNVF